MRILNPTWLGSLESPNPLAETFLFNETIIEVMFLEEVPLNDSHHCSSFLLGPMVMSMS